MMPLRTRNLPNLRFTNKVSVISALDEASLQTAVSEAIGKIEADDGDVESIQFASWSVGGTYGLSVLIHYSQQVKR